MTAPMSSPVLFPVRGPPDIYPAYQDIAYRVEFIRSVLPSLRRNQYLQNLPSRPTIYDLKALLYIPPNPIGQSKALSKYESLIRADLAKE